MTYLGVPAVAQFVSAPVVDHVVAFDLVAPEVGWAIVIGLLAAVCAVLASLTMTRPTVSSSRRAPVVPLAAARRRQPEAL